MLSSPNVIAPNVLRTPQLSSGGQLLLWSMRQWVASIRQGRCAGCDLRAPYNDLNCISAISELHEMMCVLSRSARRAIDIYQPAELVISRDERALLQIVATACPDSLRHSTRRTMEGLLHGDGRDLLEAARQYREDIKRVGLNIEGWGELRVVH